MDRNETDLRAAVPPTPDMCRDAVLHAVQTYQEERAMWKPSKMILAAALILALLCGTAYAIVNYYSVRDYVAEGKTSAAFEENIVPLEKTVTSNGLSFTLGDAVFDGRDLAFTMNIKAAEDASPVYVWPRLQAFCGETELDVDFLGMGSLSDLGAFVPNYEPEQRLMGTGGLGAEASLWQEEPQDAVTWRYTLCLYKPTGEVVQARNWDTKNETYAEWEEYLRGLYKEGKIGYNYTCSILDWMDAVVVDRDTNATYGDHILSTGLFELADTVVFEFTTAVPEKKIMAAPQTFTFDDFTLTVSSITQSFLQVDYELDVVFNEKQAHEHDVEQWYDLFDQNGAELKRRGASLTLAEDKIHCHVSGSVERISDETLTAITFVLRPIEWPEDKALPTFTVDLGE